MHGEVRRGFVLLEALVALVVIGMTSAAALELFAAHARAAARAPALVVATALARERMTTIRLLHLQRGRRLPDSLAQGAFPAPFASYRWRTSVGYSADAPLQDIQVRVEWPGGSYALGTRENLPPGTVVRGLAP